MTRDEKIQAIKDMGVSLETECPSDYDLAEDKPCCAYDESCLNCWIKTLEGQI